MIAMQIIVVILGCLMDPVSIMMITLPIFMPIVTALGFDPIWFAVIMMVNLEMGNMTPPFGMLIFVMQGVVPKDVTYEQIVWAARALHAFRRSGHRHDNGLAPDRSLAAQYVGSC